MLVVVVDRELPAEEGEGKRANITRSKLSACLHYDYHGMENVKDADEELFTGSKRKLLYAPF
jgi:hypothetical protein